MDIVYWKKFMFKIAMILILIGALNWLSVGLFQYNLVEKLLGYRSLPSRIVYIIVGVCALAILFDRDTYLPFLGETVMPCSFLQEQIPEDADTQVEVKVEPGAKVLYLAAEPATEALKKLKDWRGAYMKYMNVGVVKANEDGIAILYVRRPQPYVVPWRGRLEPHIHFRVCSEDGMMSRIQTVYVSDGRIENFTEY